MNWRRELDSAAGLLFHTVLFATAVLCFVMALAAHLRWANLAGSAALTLAAWNMKVCDALFRTARQHRIDTRGPALTFNDDAREP